MDLALRPATALDGEALAAIYAPIVRESAISFELEPPDGREMGLRIQRVQERYPWIVAERAGAILGYAYATSFRPREAYAGTAETTVYLAAEARGQGLGRRLMEALLEELRRAGLRRAVAGIALPNDPSVALHQSLGFTFVGVFREVGRKFDTWHDVGFWELGLTAAGDRRGSP